MLACGVPTCQCSFNFETDRIETNVGLCLIGESDGDELSQQHRRHCGLYDPCNGEFHFYKIQPWDWMEKLETWHQELLLRIIENADTRDQQMIMVEKTKEEKLVGKFDWSEQSKSIGRSPRSPSQSPSRSPSRSPLKSPRPLHVPVNASSRKPRFTIVGIKLGDEEEVCKSWLEHLRAIVSLPVPALNSGSQSKEPVQLAPWLWLGDASHARDIDTLRRLSVTSIVNVAGEDFKLRRPKYPTSWDSLEIELPSEFAEAYYRKDALLGDHFQRIFVFMERSVDEGRNVLVHCMTGMERSVTVCIAFLMLRNQWTLPKAVRWVVSLRPGALENQALQEELLAIAKVSNLLVKDDSVSQLIDGIQGPVDEIWIRAAGDARSIHGRRPLVDAMKSLGVESMDTKSLDNDLASLENAVGAIHYDSFKNWFMLGLKRASDLENKEKLWRGKAAQVWKVAVGKDPTIDDEARLIEATKTICGKTFQLDDLTNGLASLKKKCGSINRERFEEWFLQCSLQ